MSNVVDTVTVAGVLAPACAGLMVTATPVGSDFLLAETVIVPAYPLIGFNSTSVLVAAPPPTQPNGSLSET